MSPLLNKRNSIQFRKSMFLLVLVPVFYGITFTIQIDRLQKEAARQYNWAATMNLAVRQRMLVELWGHQVLCNDHGDQASDAAATLLADLQSVSEAVRKIDESQSAIAGAVSQQETTSQMIGRSVTEVLDSSRQLSQRLRAES